MPRRQRFKPSRKPKPAIEPSEQQQVMQSQSEVTEVQSNAPTDVEPLDDRLR